LRGQRKTLLGLADDLGVTAVELLPVFAFDEQDAPAGLVNDWGYQPVSFFAPLVGPTIDTGVSALVCAALTWLAPA